MKKRTLFEAIDLMKTKEEHNLIEIKRMKEDCTFIVVSCLQAMYCFEMPEGTSAYFSQVTLDDNGKIIGKHPVIDIPGIGVVIARIEFIRIADTTTIVSAGSPRFRFKEIQIDTDDFLRACKSVIDSKNSQKLT